MTEPAEHTVGHFRILDRLGRGGMGVVYRAEDIPLERLVALKFILPEHAADERFRIRFMREARTSAALNHPNICTVHEVAQVPEGGGLALPGGEEVPGGTPFIAMELLEGQVLADRLAEAGVLDIGELVHIALQVSRGLAAAHDGGVIHRDLKPGNMVVTTGNTVKILDFGLAKPFHEDERRPDDQTVSSAETCSLSGTQSGTVLGTVAYMSPEQAMGKPVDRRTDVFAFGTMLYEMTTGSTPFRGENASSTIAKIIEAEPRPPGELRSDFPADLSRITRRCLQKNPDDRFNDTRDLVLALEDLSDEISSGTGPTSWSTPSPAPLTVESRDPHRGSTRFRWAAIIGVLVALSVLGVLFGLGWLPRRVEPVLPTHRQITFTGNALLGSISPDGQTVAYIEGQADPVARLLVQDISGGRPLEILTSENLQGVEWSPSGSELLVSGSIGGKYGAYVIPRFGGEPRLVANARLLAWSPNSRRLAITDHPWKKINILDLATGERTTLPVEGDFTWINGVDWAPSEQRILFLTKDQDRGTVIWTIRPDGEDQQALLEVDDQEYGGVGRFFFRSGVRWSPAGDAVYFLGDTGELKNLVKVRVGPMTGKRAGQPTPVLSGLDAVAFSISGDGTRLIYDRGDFHSHLWLYELDTAPDVDGSNGTQLTHGTTRDTSPRFSPDGRSVAFARSGSGGSRNIFIMSVGDRSVRQLTFFDCRAVSPVWSPDSETIAFSCDMGGTPRVWTVRLSDGRTRSFDSALIGDGHLAWAPDRRILYQRPGNRNFHFLDPETEEQVPLISDDNVGWAFDPRISPDGGNVAVLWNRRAKDGSKARGIWTISVADASEQFVFASDKYPKILGWSPDGHWLYVLEKIPKPELLRIPACGGDPETVKIGLSEEVVSGHLSPDGKYAVFSVGAYRFDLWLIENFDPDLR